MRLYKRFFTLFLGEFLWYRRRCNRWSRDVSFLFEFLHGFTLLTLKVRLDVFGLIDRGFHRCSRSPCMLALTVFSPTTVLLRSIFGKRIELLFPTPSSVD